MELHLTRDQAALEFRVAADTLDALYDTVDRFLTAITTTPSPPTGPDPLTAMVDYVELVRDHLANLEQLRDQMWAAATAAAQHKSRTVIATTYGTRRSTLFPDRTPNGSTNGDAHSPAHATTSTTNGSVNGDTHSPDHHHDDSGELVVGQGPA